MFDAIHLVADLQGELSKEERSNLEKKLTEYQYTLATSPQDAETLEAAAVINVQLQQYQRQEDLLKQAGGAQEG